MSHFLRFAKSLHRLRSEQNAPYLHDFSFGVSGVSAHGEAQPALADVVLQMIHNFINAGPLTGKVDRHETARRADLELEVA